MAVVEERVQQEGHVANQNAGDGFFLESRR